MICSPLSSCLLSIHTFKPAMADRPNNSANGIGNEISNIEKVIASSLRPLPTETGDGTYVKTPTTTGFTKDLGHFNSKDVKAVIEIAKDAVTGEPWNDREYIMERVVQVCTS